MRRLRYGQIQPCHRTHEEAVAGDRLTCAAQGCARTPRRPCSAASTASPSRGASQPPPRPPVSPDHRALGRVGLASELTARGASTTETMLAGSWKPLASSLTTARRNRRVGRRRQVPVSQVGAVRILGHVASATADVSPAGARASPSNTQRRSSAAGAVVAAAA